MVKLLKCKAELRNKIRSLVPDAVVIITFGRNLQWLRASLAHVVNRDRLWLATQGNETNMLPSQFIFVASERDFIERIGELTSVSLS